jgi:hypothetical protein
MCGGEWHATTPALIKRHSWPASSLSRRPSQKKLVGIASFLVGLKNIVMQLKHLILGFALACTRTPAIAQAEPAAAQADARSFASPAAAAAHGTYAASMSAVRLKYLAELDLALKVALAAGSLDDANAISALRQKLTGDSAPAPAGPFKTSQANEARIRYEMAVAAARRQYGRDLQQALKQAMAAANLAEANEINGEIKKLLVLLASASPSNAPPPIGQSARTARGLEIVRYRRHPSQSSGDGYNGYVPLADLGKPIGAPHTVRSLSSWTKDVDENAVVSGFIKIDKAGVHEFRTDSGFDRNELIINGAIVCKFRDGPNKAQSVQLNAGLIPVTSIGYATHTSETRIQWRPPGQADWSSIPNELLSH